MKFYTIENETNNIAVHASAKEAQAVPNTRRFTTEATFARLAAEWPTLRLISIWNTLPGVIPVRKFASRKLAVSRIWSAVQRLGDETQEVAGDRKTDGPQDRKATDTVIKTPPSAHGKRKKAGETSHGISRTDAILALLSRPQGAGLNEIMQETGWQAHSVRGFISGVLRKKMKLNVISAADEGVRTYRIGSEDRW
jgi:hypothetical protein